MKKVAAPWKTVLAVTLMSLPGLAQTPPPSTVLGQVEGLDAATRTISVRLDDGSTLLAALAEGATLVKVAPGEKSLQNAASIEFAGLSTGDRVLLRGGARSEARIEGVSRVVVMARTDLAARSEAEQRAWRERAVAGTVTAVDAPSGQFTMRVSSTASAAGPPGAPGAFADGASVVVDARNAELHRYSDTSVRYEDARPARIQDMAGQDQLRLLGTRSADGARITAERVVFGSFRTRAVAIESVNVDTGVLEVKDLESNQRFALSLSQGGTIRRIPPEMGPMLTMLARGQARPGGARPYADPAGPGARRPERAPDANAGIGGGRPGSRGSGAASPEGRTGMGARGPGGGGRGGPQGLVERMPTITLADLKKDDWVGAVVGKIDASGHAIAFNLLAGIEVFASSANRDGGVDVGMPAGLLDGALDVP